MENRNTVTATLKHLHIAPRKTRLIVDVIRGLSVNEAEARLLLSPRRPSEPLLKLLRSAAANARNNFKMNEENLFIQEARVDAGPTMKRWIPRARGATSPIAKRTSHVTLVLGVNEKTTGTPFTIIRPEKKKETNKKTKKAQEEKVGDREAHKHEEHEHGDKSAGKKQKGFMQKVFRRKSV